MSLINEVFKNKPAFVGYLTAGHGGFNRSLDYFHALVDGGVDILEVGVPFSDPVADGLVIQESSKAALAQGMTLDRTLDLISALRQKTNVPIILFSYFNPIYTAQKKADFFARARQAGVDGCLIVDMNLEESADFYQSCIANDIDPIYILSTSTPSQRIRKIAQLSKGMLYYACQKGTTGVKNDLPQDLKSKIESIKKLTDLPIACGFGISNQSMAKQIINHAHGFVVGSLFVDAIAKGSDPKALKNLAVEIDPRNLR